MLRWVEVIDKWVPQHAGSHRWHPLPPVVAWPPDQEVFRWQGTSVTMSCPFSSMSKRRGGYPSEAKVKRGDRVVRGDKEFLREPGSCGWPAVSDCGVITRTCGCTT